MAAANNSARNLIALLQLAYSAELAAGYAYRGHWHSVEDADERIRIEQIEDEEWHHRKLVGEMLESRNVGEYETAARYARDCGREDFIDCLLTMAEVEWEHEYYFRARVLTHPLGRRLSLWPAPPPKEMIRASFAQESEQHLELVEVGLT